MNKVNVYGSFAQSLLFSGNASVPKYLLEHYTDLGLNDQEMLILIHIISAGEAGTYLSPDSLSARMSATGKEIEEALVRLVEKKLIAIEKHWDQENNQWINNYNLQGLLDELAECWAIDQVKLFQAEQNRKNVSPADLPKPTPPDPAVPPLIKVFEHEMGRPLTEMECNYIKGWQQNCSDELITEALRRGVSAGIRNFRYLDSILREWEKKGLKTKEEVLADDIQFQNRQEEKHKAKTRSANKTSAGKYEDFYL